MDEFHILCGLPGKKDAKWLGCAASFDAAQQRMKQLAVQQPGTYFIFNSWNCCVVSQVNTQATPLLRVPRAKNKTVSAA